MLETIVKVSELLTKQDRRLLASLVLFSVLIAIIETIGITAIMPFIKLVMDNSIIHSNQYYLETYQLFGFQRDKNFVIAIGVLLIVFYLFRSMLNLIYFYSMSRFSQGRYLLIANRLFRSYVEMPYKSFVGKNTSTMTKSIINEATGLIEILTTSLLMMSELFVIGFMYSLMLWVDYKITLALTLILGINVILLTKPISSRMKTIGQKREEIEKDFYEIINRTLSNFKLIKLHFNQQEILDDFYSTSHKKSKIGISFATWSHFPRLFLEAVGFSLIVLIIIFLVWKGEGDITAILATLSMFVMALYRLLPSVNRIMTGYNHIAYYTSSLNVVHRDLMHDSEELGDETIEFNDNIYLKNISFDYHNTGAQVLENLTLKIKKGEKIALIGESGSGKSTLADIAMGLYRPTQGEITIDEKILDDNNIKDWRAKIGYIPQAIYLFDGTVEENIIFGREYNKERVIECLKLANIYDFLKTKKGPDTLVGEGGIMLSGGQKQRIAIARALYQNPEILVLDEATSALDDKTEKKIMEEIYKISQDKTLIIIAHRLSTIEKCDKTYQLQKGTLEDN